MYASFGVHSMGVIIGMLKNSRNLNPGAGCFGGHVPVAAAPPAFTRGDCIWLDKVAQ